MEVLITGGNGFVGRHLATDLLARGDSVRVLALPDEDTSSLDPRCTVHRGDIRDAETLTGAVEGADALVHLAAMMHVWKPLGDYELVNVQGTINVCRAALAAEVGRVVHMSSSTVYGMESVGPVDESHPLAPFADPYSLTKAEADRAVRRLIRHEGLPAVILRPDQIFGPGDRLHFGETAARLRAGRGVIVGRGDNFIPLVYIDDMVQALLLALDSPNAVGEAFNISSDEPLTQKEFLDCVAGHVAGRRARVRVPLRPLTLAAHVAEWVFSAGGRSRRPPITRLGAAFAATSVRFSVEKARAQLGYTPSVPLREGIRRSAIWYLESIGAASPTAEGRVSSESLGSSELPGSSGLQGSTNELSVRSKGNRTALRGKVAVITGASSGIGAATARELAGRGVKVVLAGRRADRLQLEEEGIIAAGGEALSVPTDITDSEQVEHLIKEAESHFGRVDILVNNAGVFWRRSFADTPPEDLTQLMQVNLVGAMLAARAALPGMLERGQGSIIMIGSVSGRVAMEPVYSASKYGLRGFSLGLRRQLNGTGVTVCCVEPGNIRTDMTEHVAGTLPEPELVARAVVKLVERPRREIVIPQKHYAIVWLEQTFPALADLAYHARHWSPVD